MKSGNTSKITAIAVASLSIGMYAMAQKGGSAGHGGGQMTQPQSSAPTAQQTQKAPTMISPTAPPIQTVGPSASPGASASATASVSRPSSTPRASASVKTSPTPPGKHKGWQKGKHNPHHSPAPSASPSATASASATATGTP